jgi:hypothetical protein
MLQRRLRETALTLGDVEEMRARRLDSMRAVMAFIESLA